MRSGLHFPSDFWSCRSRGPREDVEASAPRAVPGGAPAGVLGGRPGGDGGRGVRGGVAEGGAELGAAQDAALVHAAPAAHTGLHPLQAHRQLRPPVPVRALCQGGIVFRWFFVIASDIMGGMWNREALVFRLSC